MPQMAPISWLTLFLMFSITFMLFNVLNYYCFFSSNDSTLKENSNKTVNNTLNWKW